MQVQVHAKTRSVHITEDTRTYLEKKLSRLGKHFRHEPAALCAQSFERGQHIIEITVDGDNMTLRSQERHSDLHTAIDSVVDKLEGQLRRFKERRIDSHRQSSIVKAMAEAELSAEAEPFAPRIVRRKTYPMKSMPPEEAARQMELLGHSFFMFLDEETSKVGVIYRRMSGDYGLIEPEI